MDSPPSSSEFTLAPVCPELLLLLRCPDTMQPLHAASPELMARINRDRLPDRSGRVLPAPLAAGLLREDGALLYPIRDGIPLLLSEAAIPLFPTADSSQLHGGSDRL